MPVYVAEISMRPIFAFDAADAEAAKARFADKEFLGDLYVLQTEGHPLWDGHSSIQLRLAHSDEIEAWQAGHESDRLSRAFLIPVVDPLKFADPEDNLNEDDDLDDDRD